MRALRYLLPLLLLPWLTLALALGLVALPAAAQQGTPSFATVTATTGTFGAVTFGGKPLTGGGTTGTQVNGVYGSLTLGTGAGAALPANSIFSTFIGYNAGNKYTGSGGEATCVGTVACANLTTGTFGTALGENALGAETAAVGATAIGNDSQRNYVGGAGGNGAGNTSMGKNSLRGGGGGNNVAIGQNAMFGNASLTTITGSATNGDNIALTFTGSYVGSPRTVSVPITAGETTTQMAAALLAAAQADAVLSTGTYVANSASQANVVQWEWMGTATTGVTLVITSNVTGAATEVVTTTGGSTGNGNVALGFNALSGQFSLTTGAQNVAIGTNALANASTTTNDVCAGQAACQNVSTGHDNIALGATAMQGAAAGVAGNFNISIGDGSMIAATGAGQNVVIGHTSGNKLTNGGANVILGPAVATTTLTTGNNNILIGTTNATDVDIANRNSEINIGNVLFYTNVSTAVPVISACGTSPAVDARANMKSGTVTTGTGAPASCTITFASPYRAWNHCRVTSQLSLAAFAYSYTLAAITVTATSLNSGKIDYDCDGT